MIRQFFKEFFVQKMKIPLTLNEFESVIYNHVYRTEYDNSDSFFRNSVEEEISYQIFTYQGNIHISILLDSTRINCTKLRKKISIYIYDN